MSEGFGQIYSDSTFWVEVKNIYALPDENLYCADSNLTNFYLTAGIEKVTKAFPYSKDSLLKRVYEYKCGNCNIDDIRNVFEQEFNNYFGIFQKHEIDTINPALYDPTDYFWSLTNQNPSSWLWHLKKIEADKAWDITLGNSEIVVALIDTEFDNTHLDLENQLITNSDPFTGQPYDCSSPPGSINYHGTACAGLVAAEGNGGDQSVGVGFNTKLIGYHYDVLRARYLQKAQHASLVLNVDILTSSTVHPGCSLSDFENAAINEIINHGTTLVMPAGNGINGNRNSCLVNGVLTDRPFFPISALYNEDIILVSSTDKNDKHYFWDTDKNIEGTHSHYPEVDLCAPGYGVHTLMSTDCGNNTDPFFGNNHGTSYATPIVAGVAALMLSVNPCLEPADVQFILKTTTDPIVDEANYSGLLGTGRVNAFEAVKLAQTYGNVSDVLINTIWSSNRFVKGNVVIKNNSTLTISSDITLANDACIIVEPGSKLILDGAYLTNAKGCNSSLWQGIIVKGNNNLSQSTTNQGIVELKNGAVIENAKVAVSLWDKDDHSTSGSYILAQNSTFRNNQWDIEFPPYRNFLPNSNPVNYAVNDKSNVTNCTFEITEPLINGEAYNHRISLWGRNNIWLRNNTFKVTDPSILLDPIYQSSPHNGHYLTGIYSVDSELNLTSACSSGGNNANYICPEQDLQANTFENLHIGVFVERALKNPQTRIDRSVFNNCQKGVYVHGVNDVKITRNYIHFNPAPATIGGEPAYDESFLHKAVGILAEASTLNLVEENTLTGLGNANSNFINNPQLGIVALNLGGDEQFISHNTGTDFRSSMQGEGENIDLITKQGLTFLCNTNTKNGFDISAVEHTGQVSNGIAKFQGTLAEPAGNTFTANPFWSFTHLYNNSKSSFEYTYYLKAGNQIPTNYTNVWVSLFQGPNPYDCQSSFEKNTGIFLYGETPIGLLNAKAAYRSATASWLNNLYNLNQLIDGGNTNALLTQVQSTWPEDAYILRNDLLAESPYLSIDLLMNTVLEDILPYAMLYEVLIANPEVSSSPEFTEFLYTESQVPHYMIQSLEAMQDTVTPRTIIEQNLATASKARTLAANTIIRYYQSDTLQSQISTDSIKYYLKNLSTFSSYCQLAEFYFQEGNTTQSAAYYDSLETQFELTPTQQNEVTQFRALSALRFGLQGENRGLDSLTIGELNQLQTIADTSYLMAGAMARAMLRRYQDPYLPEVTLPNPNFVKRSRVRMPWPEEENKKEVNKKLQTKIEVFPNPSNEGFTVKLTAINPNSKLRITDLQGKVVYSKNLNEQESTQIIATQGWAKGVYQASIEVEGVPIIKEKLILQ